MSRLLNFLLIVVDGVVPVAVLPRVVCEGVDIVARARQTRLPLARTLVEGLASRLALAAWRPIALHHVALVLYHVPILLLCSWWNGVARYWFDAYLKSRDPLPINTNPFFVLEEDPTPSRNSQVRSCTTITTAIACR